MKSGHWKLHSCMFICLFFSLADYHTVTIAGAVCFSLVLAGVLKCMHAGGYILQKKSLPSTLVCNHSHM